MEQVQKIVAKGSVGLHTHSCPSLRERHGEANRTSTCINGIQSNDAIWQKYNDETIKSKHPYYVCVCVSLCAYVCVHVCSERQRVSGMIYKKKSKK